MSPQKDHLISLTPKRPEKEKINSFLSKQTCSEVLECINEGSLIKTRGLNLIILINKRGIPLCNANKIYQGHKSMTLIGGF